MKTTNKNKKNVERIADRARFHFAVERLTTNGSPLEHFMLLKLLFSCHNFVAECSMFAVLGHLDRLNSELHAF